MLIFDSFSTIIDFERFTTFLKTRKQMKQKLIAIYKQQKSQLIVVIISYSLNKRKEFLIQRRFQLRELNNENVDIIETWFK